MAWNMAWHCNSSLMSQCGPELRGPGVRGGLAALLLPFHVEVLVRHHKLCSPSHIQWPWVGVCVCWCGCDISQSLLMWTSHSAIPGKQVLSLAFTQGLCSWSGSFFWSSGSGSNWKDSPGLSPKPLQETMTLAFPAYVTGRWETAVGNFSRWGRPGTRIQASRPQSSNCWRLAPSHLLHPGAQHLHTQALGLPCSSLLLLSQFKRGLQKLYLTVPMGLQVHT